MGLEITNQYIINAPVSRIWEVLVDEFTDVATWVSGLDASGPNPQATHIPEGAPAAGRSCVIPGLGATDERFTVFDPDNHRFGYSVDAEKLPSFVSNMENVWTLRSRGPRTTEVTQRLTADVSGPLGVIMKPMMKLQFNRLLKTIKGDLAAYAETGRVSEAKAKELAKAGR
ncbi:SRPBCC family protein [Euzebya tangerina]|uniref:SRPBCC family protein n=1 Tax=Euzebya tangerina TaxID=591198 RepID=UPI000E31C314|nr:SRPBCC family protein [Euzebya tangerina]